MNPQTPAPVDDDRPSEIPERITTAQQALDRFHDEHSPLGRVRRVCWPVDDSDDGVGRATIDKDPYD
jgi:hypothetical protein